MLRVAAVVLFLSGHVSQSLLVQSGEIVVEFNSKNKKGKRNQKVTLDC